ncbi:MAG TPA: DUF3500 domain-containing protein [Methylomirabilota bacterium]|nr:DUF3500 domain-containing protein [Methylomirabilota bacterium]
MNSLLLLCSFVGMLILGLAPQPARAHPAADEMATAAASFLAALTPEQKATATFPLKDEHRLDWHFIPKERKGLALKAMTVEQQHLTVALLAASLSSQGLMKASSIMSLEAVLQVIEGPNRRFPRDPLLYHVSIFGEPKPGQTWAWRFEGHHLSLNFTVVKGEHVAATPSFMGTNPDIVPEGPRQGQQVLAAEENIGRQLAKSLTVAQRAKAVFSDQAPPDILTEARRKISPLEPRGIGWSELDADQRELLWILVKLYVQRSRGEIAEAELKKITEAGRDKIHFAWAGGMARGQGHYYRVQGPTFLIEYDNTQNNANHIHAVYRDFENDFGEDLLRRHYEQARH